MSMHPKVEAAAKIIADWARDTGGNPDDVATWDGEKMTAWTGDDAYLSDRFAGAVVYEDSSFDAVAWPFRLQRDLDPQYEVGIFEPYNYSIITLWLET